MARTLTDGEREILAELQDWDDLAADELDTEADEYAAFEAMMAEEFDSMRLLAEAHARWDAQEQERLAAALQSPLGQRYLWGDAA
jgi:L-alanine-DL-glutamate epimerase-like enolase superfamily enzyme